MKNKFNEKEILIKGNYDNYKKKLNQVLEISFGNYECNIIYNEKTIINRMKNNEVNKVQIYKVRLSIKKNKNNIILKYNCPRYITSFKLFGERFIINNKKNVVLL